MTGYASVSPTDAVTVECRSVNGRFLDLSLKLPEEWRALEPAVRERVSAAIKRGKVELRVVLHETGPGGPSLPSPQALAALQQAQHQVRAVLPQARELSVAEVLSMSRAPSAAAAPDAQSLQAVEACLQALKDSRQREGQRLVEVLLDRVALLEDLARRAEPLIPAVVKRQQARFLERWHEALQAADAAGSVGPQAMQERALSEAAAFAIRIDVAEELARLKAHLQEITRLLHAGGEVGKRLDFLIQELHREANTLGSKSAALELTGLSVDMKVAIEQMREQVQNVE